MSRRARRRARRNPPSVPPLRFWVGPDGEIGYPAEPLGWPAPRSSGPAHPALPRTEVTGVAPESLADAAASGDLADLLLPDGNRLYDHHLRIEHFAYAFVPVPTLTLVLPPSSDDGPSTRMRFVDAVVTDWTTDADYSPADPNDELCEFRWDGWRTFLLEFLSAKIIVRASRLEVEVIE
ncbi:MAG: hypothetical protein PGN15_02855 [Aeromicrobium erythreum]